MSNSGVCPVCNGSGRMEPKDYHMPYAEREGWYGWSAEDRKVKCDNCGGQYQWGTPNGKVRLRKDNGEPCVHDYEGTAGPWRCTTNYTCKHCGDTYMIDSGD